MNQISDLHYKLRLIYRKIYSDLDELLGMNGYKFKIINRLIKDRILKNLNYIFESIELFYSYEIDIRIQNNFYFYHVDKVSNILDRINPCLEEMYDLIKETLYITSILRNLKHSIRVYRMVYFEIQSVYEDDSKFVSNYKPRKCLFSCINF